MARCGRRTRGTNNDGAAPIVVYGHISGGSSVVDSIGGRVARAALDVYGWMGSLAPYGFYTWLYALVCVALPRYLRQHGGLWTRSVRFIPWLAFTAMLLALIGNLLSGSRRTLREAAVHLPRLTCCAGLTLVSPSKAQDRRREHPEWRLKAARVFHRKTKNESARIKISLLYPHEIGLASFQHSWIPSPKARQRP